MTELERLQKISEGLSALSLVRQDEIADGYKSLIMKALEENNFDMTKVDCIRPEIGQALTDSYDRDYIELRLTRNSINDHTYSLDIYVRKSKVEFNNCCSGNWSKGDGYYTYVKAMSIVAEISEQILNYGLMQNRQPLVDAWKARLAEEDEEDRIKSEKRAKELQAKKEEIEKAEYLGHYRVLRSYEDGYIEGEETFILDRVYKVLKKTNKFVYALQYYNNEYAEDDKDIEPGTHKAYRPSRYLGYCNHEDKLRKENIYNHFWKAITKDDIQIID